MRYFAIVDEAKIEGDEDGFHLIVETDEGDHFNFFIHNAAEEFAKSVKSTIGEWLAERDHARDTRPRLITEEDLDGYEPGDPKRVELQRFIDRGGR